jgi:hypothetical protein
MRGNGLWHPVLALGLLLEVDLRLRLTGFARVRSWVSGLGSRVWGIEPSPPETQARSDLRADAERLELWLRWASRFVPGARCLHRSLALMLWLRRRGVRADLRMGVRAQDGTVQGHAWVEWDGVPIGEPPSVREEYGLLETVEAK